MKLVYIASPYTGDIPNNVERAKEYCKQALEQGVIPVAPHLLYPQFLEDSDPQSEASTCGPGWNCLPAVKKCGSLEEKSHRA